MDLLLDEPGTRRLFVNTMQGCSTPVAMTARPSSRILISTIRNGATGPVRRGANGLQSFAFHPQFTQAGTPGAGKFYTYFDTGHDADGPTLSRSAAPYARDSAPSGPSRSEGSGVTTAPHASSSGSRIHFPTTTAGNRLQPARAAGSAEFGLLYIGSPDGGSAGDP